jgi:hypothetical protein
MQQFAAAQRNREWDAHHRGQCGRGDTLRMTEMRIDQLERKLFPNSRQRPPDAHHQKQAVEAASP